MATTPVRNTNYPLVGILRYSTHAKKAEDDISNKAANKSKLAQNTEYTQLCRTLGEAEKNQFLTSEGVLKTSTMVANICFQGNLFPYARLIVEYAHLRCTSLTYSAIIGNTQLSTSVRELHFRRFFEMADSHNMSETNDQLDNAIQSRSRFIESEDDETSVEQMTATDKTKLLMFELQKKMLLKYVGLPERTGENPSDGVLKFRGAIFKTLPIYNESELTSLVSDICPHTLVEALEDDEAIIQRALNNKPMLEKILESIRFIVPKAEYMQPANLAGYKIEPQGFLNSAARMEYWKAQDALKAKELEAANASSKSEDNAGSN